ncbi:hypothetical protein GFL38_10590 [Rhizobium leguminosarum bv. viciae]|uniref:hypothetical protein n=1 Tax=Rhizobium ruizarguesonis TaxID=2081791 RepID=UPI00143F1652|nr:hypothetical protein [Rhizobium ruizarguesonis]NKJ72712.1 hypothetical protein [Rhizobium leguminosarum bv. viciae]NKQ80391.1 hypothetical protein [Rhizobium ruizarguesonis]
MTVDPGWHAALSARFGEAVPAIEMFHIRAALQPLVESMFADLAARALVDRGRWAGYERSGMGDDPSSIADRLLTALALDILRCASAR